MTMQDPMLALFWLLFFVSVAGAGISAVCFLVAMGRWLGSVMTALLAREAMD